MSRFKPVLFITALLLCWSSYSFAQIVPEKFISTQILEQGKLEMVWQTKLPIKKDSETLEQLHLLDNRIYAVSSLNYICSLNRGNGNVVFSRPFAHPGFPTLGVDTYKGKLFTIAGNDLIEINSQLGKQISSTHLQFAATSPAARNKTYFYIAGTDKRLHAIFADNKVQHFEATAKNDSVITRICAEEEYVTFSTNAGNVIRILSDKPKKQWQFDASDAIVGKIVKNETSIFVASKDTNVYRINIRNGQLLWKYQTSAILDREPRVTKKIVYQYAPGEGLTAIDKKTGQKIWTLSDGIDLLAESGNKAYVIANNSTLIVMDNKKNKMLYSTTLATVDRYVSNQIDSKIYVGDKTGKLACLRPAK